MCELIACADVNGLPQHKHRASAGGTALHMHVHGAGVAPLICIGGDVV